MIVCGVCYDWSGIDVWLKIVKLVDVVGMNVWNWLEKYECCVWVWVRFEIRKSIMKVILWICVEEWKLEEKLCVVDE